MEDERYDYRCCLGIEEKRRKGLKALLRGLRSRLVDNMSLIDSVRDLLREDIDFDLVVYFQSSQRLLQCATVRLAFFVLRPGLSIRIL